MLPSLPVLKPPVQSTARWGCDLCPDFHDKKRFATGKGNLANSVEKHMLHNHPEIKDWAPHVRKWGIRFYPGDGTSIDMTLEEYQRNGPPAKLLAPPRRKSPSVTEDIGCKTQLDEKNTDHVVEEKTRVRVPRRLPALPPPTSILKVLKKDQGGSSDDEKQEIVDFRDKISSSSTVSKIPLCATDRFTEKALMMISCKPEPDIKRPSSDEVPDGFEEYFSQLHATVKLDLSVLYRGPVEKKPGKKEPPMYTIDSVPLLRPMTVGPLDREMLDGRYGALMERVARVTLDPAWQANLSRVELRTMQEHYLRLTTFIMSRLAKKMELEDEDWKDGIPLEGEEEQEEEQDEGPYCSL